jgi:hypothetical protein
MSAVSETIVREYFEHHDFFVHQQRKYLSKVRREEEEMDFVVFNPRYQASNRPLPFELAPADLKQIGRAVVSVKGWHSDTFSASLLTSTPEMFRFLDTASLRHIEQSTPDQGPLFKLLVIPGLPVTKEVREQSVEFLRAKGLDAIISFRTILADLIDHVEINRNYQKSDLLQMLRILKNYDFFKEPQLELFKAKKHPPKARRTAAVPAPKE